MAKEVEMSPSLQGRCLIATPAIEDPMFRRTVVWMVHHDTAGALGFILNRPMADTTVPDMDHPWAGNFGDLHIGGPVEATTCLALALAKTDAPRHFTPLIGRIGYVDLDGPAPDSEEVAGVRVFAGCASWSEGQLEAEIDEGSWFVTNTDDHQVVMADPATLWSQMWRRQSGEVRYWATLPDDPASN